MEETLKNPTRQRILEILCTRKTVSPKEIAKELKMGVPAVYYHIDLMRGLVTKTSRGEFAATDRGLAAYRELLRDDVLSKSPVGQIAPHLDFITRLFSLKTLLPAGVAVAALEFVLCYLYGFRPYFFGYGSFAASGQIPLFLYYIGNIVLLFIIIEGASYAMTRRVGGEVYLAGGIMLARLPLLFIMLPKILGTAFWLTSAVTFAVGPLLSIAVLAIMVSLTKGIRIELAFIMSFVLLYFDLFIYSLL